MNASILKHVLPLGLTEQHLLWIKASILFFFLGIFLIVLYRVISRGAAAYESDASIVLHDEPVMDRLKTNNKSRSIKEGQHE